MNLWGRGGGRAGRGGEGTVGALTIRTTGCFRRFPRTTNSTKTASASVRTCSAAPPPLCCAVARTRLSGKRSSPTDNPGGEPEKKRRPQTGSHPHQDRPASAPGSGADKAGSTQRLLSSRRKWKAGDGAHSTVVCRSGVESDAWHHLRTALPLVRRRPWPPLHAAMFRGTVVRCAVRLLLHWSCFMLQCCMPAPPCVDHAPPRPTAARTCGCHAMRHATYSKQQHATRDGTNAPPRPVASLQAVQHSPTLRQGIHRHHRPLSTQHAKCAHRSRRSRQSAIARRSSATRSAAMCAVQH